MLQVITIDQNRFESYRRRPEFIQRYIFPGGILPTKEILEQLVAKSGLRLRLDRSFSAKVTRARSPSGIDAFWKPGPSIEALGFDDRFKRMWEYYLAYCRFRIEIGVLNVGLYKIERQFWVRYPIRPSGSRSQRSSRTRGLFDRAVILRPGSGSCRGKVCSEV